MSEFGDWFSYDKTPRSMIIDRDHAKVKDLDSLMKLMRYNDFKNDPAAHIRGKGVFNTFVNKIWSFFHHLPL